MSHVLRLELTDGLFTAISQQAAAEQVPPETVAVRMLQDHLQFPKPAPSNGARSSFREMFGAADLGVATGLDNEGIDADLAKEYGRGLDD
jgi:hypothetical protein